MAVVRRGIRGLYRTGITRMAAALAFRTIFSIIPVIAIGLLIFGSVVSEDQVDSGVRRLLGFAGISQITVSPTDAPPIYEPSVDAPDTDADPDPATDDEAAQIDEIITDLVIRVNDTLQSLPMGWLALVTGLVLLYAALSMLVEVEKSFNAVCGAPVGRSWLRRLILYWTMLTLGGVLLAATFWTGDALANWVKGTGGSAFRSTLAGYGVSVLISTVLLTVAYMAIPTVRLKLRAVLAGAFLAAVAWELGKWGFTSYLRYSTNYARFYGSLAVLPLFMMWVYVTWVIVLLGLQSAYTLQNFTRLMASKESDRDGPKLVDPASAVALAGALVRRHRQGESPDAGELSDMLNLDASVVESLLRRLEKAGLVRRVMTGSDEEAGWMPGRPAENIEVGEVLDAVGDLDASSGAGECGEMLCELTEARKRAARGRSLADAVPDTRRRGKSGSGETGRETPETPDPGAARPESS
ncbi:MAG: YihY family inner membrane protein [Phycisphaerales bacterium]|nr:YihY family inner membrane protein [Planctomycetota bacterium]MCH8508975.1 YihY family inner membrane protein [Phycisphaerales bacterium]